MAHPDPAHVTQKLSAAVAATLSCYHHGLDPGAAALPLPRTHESMLWELLDQHQVRMQLQGTRFGSERVSRVKKEKRLPAEKQQMLVSVPLFIEAFILCLRSVAQG